MYSNHLLAVWNKSLGLEIQRRCHRRICYREPMETGQCPFSRSFLGPCWAGGSLRFQLFSGKQQSGMHRSLASCFHRSSPSHSRYHRHTAHRGCGERERSLAAQSWQASKQPIDIEIHIIIMYAIASVQPHDIGRKNRNSPLLLLYYTQQAT